MNKRLVSLLAIASIFLTTNLFAEENSAPLTFSLSTDATYSPKTNNVVSNVTHFAPITGIYSGVGARTTFNASYTIHTPLGTNALVKDDTLVFTGSIELSPITILPKIKVTFTPIAFLVFSAGTMAGTGWNLLGSMQGISEYNASTKTYDDLKTGNSWYINTWASGTFQFDTGALWPGDWHHIVIQATYEVDYITLTNTDSSVWNWQMTYGSASGWQQYQSYIIGYQMPLALAMVGTRIELTGHYNSSDYDVYADSYNGDFTSVDISPLLVFNFPKKDTLFILFNFQGRRGYSEEYASAQDEINLTNTCTEWYFRRLALSWTHTF